MYIKLESITDSESTTATRRFQRLPNSACFKIFPGMSTVLRNLFGMLKVIYITKQSIIQFISVRDAQMRRRIAGAH